MSFFALFAAGLLGGLFGGMGMGGGTLLIPALTLLLGVEQTAAQGINLLAFVPMSLVALRVHAREGRLRREGLSALLPAAVVFSGAGALAASFLPSVLLRKGFGLFLIFLSVFPIREFMKKFNI